MVLDSQWIHSDRRLEAFAAYGQETVRHEEGAYGSKVIDELSKGKGAFILDQSKNSNTLGQEGRYELAYADDGIEQEKERQMEWNS